LRTALVLMGLFSVYVVPAATQSASGISEMRYYVGTWSCRGGMLARKPSTATATYTIDDNILHQWVDVPAQGTMKQPYVLASSTTFDAKTDRFVELGIGNDGQWWVAYAKPSGANGEVWMDHATASGRLGRSQTIRINQNTFTTTGYPTATSTSPSFRVTCHR
jgi:hypothetical protein